jgi:hypothetical protein
MASITYKSLSALQPVELKYQYYRDEEFKNTKLSFAGGYTIYKHDTLKNYQDTTINKESAFVLTSSVPLNKVFPEPDNYNLGKLPGTIYLQPRNTATFFAAYKGSTKNFVLSSSGTPFYISPVPGTNEVEILVNNQFLQVNKNYPYEVTIEPKPLIVSERFRQRFEYVLQNSTLTFKTKTQEGYRYLAFNNDNILRATGVYFNAGVVNDYIFKYVPVTQSNFKLNFKPENPWLTYYNSFLEEQNNKTVTVNKEFLVPTNFLIDFPVEEAAKTGKAHINIANLKTNVTPFGSPAPVNNLPSTDLPLP